MAKNRKARAKAAHRKAKASPRGRQSAASVSVTVPGIYADLPSEHPSHSSNNSPDSHSSQADPAPPPRLRKTREDLLDWLEDAIFTPPGEITKDSPIVQEFTQEVTTGKDGSETTHLHVKVVNKMPAARLLCQLNGWIKSRTSESKDKPVKTCPAWLKELRAETDDDDFEFVPVDEEGNEIPMDEATDEVANESDNDFQAEEQPSYQSEATEQREAVAVAKAEVKSISAHAPKAKSTAKAKAEAEAEAETEVESEAETESSSESKSQSETDSAPTPKSESESEPEYDENGCRVDKDRKVWVTMDSIRKVAWASKREREKRRRRQAQGHKYEIPYRSHFPSHSGFH